MSLRFSFSLARVRVQPNVSVFINVFRLYRPLLRLSFSLEYSSRLNTTGYFVNKISFILCFIRDTIAL